MDPEDLARRLRQTFALEVEEQVHVLNAELLDLERDPSGGDGLRAVFRVVHSLKGASRAAGVGRLERACHLLEARLANLRKTGASPDKEDFARLFAFADALGEVSERLGTGADLEGSALEGMLRSWEGRTTTPPAELAPRTPRRRPARTQPSPIPDDAAPAARRRPTQVRVGTSRLDALLASTGELLLVQGAVERGTRELADLATEMESFASRWRAAGEGPLDPEVQRLGRKLQDVARGARRAGRGLAAAVGRVNGEVTGLRLRPLAEVTEPLGRAVRDLAIERGKDVRFEVHGGEVEVDRAVLDGLADPLLHLVRNAVDHGIEPPDVRTRARKPAAGTIRVAARLRGVRVEVSVSDDGAGVDVGAVRRALADEGMAVPGDDAAVLQALLGAGVSTRPSADAISGRGMGLDIVRHALQRLHGSVEVATGAGEGTTFTLACPPSLNTLRAVVVRAGGATLAFPTAHVGRLARVRVADLARVGGRPVVEDDGVPLPLAGLAGLLGPPLVARPPAEVVSVVVLRNGKGRRALLVDELVAEDELLLRPGEDAASSPWVSGVAVLGEGKVVPVLDVSALLETTAPAGDDLPGPAATAAGEERRRILVVDDSITTRTLEESVLVAAGYDVTTAVDGADAWRTLQEGAFDLVVADVDMPRMDGFDLCRAIRASRGTRSLPVILVTALETPEHRMRGMEAGADAYIGKAGFDQEQLLVAVRQLLG